MITLSQFKALPYIANFCEDDYVIKCTFSYKDMGALIKEEWKAKKDKIINELTYYDFNERRLKEFDDEEIDNFIDYLLNINLEDISYASEGIIVDNFNKYEANISEYHLDYIDLENNVIMLTI